MNTKGCNINLITAIRSIGLTQRDVAERIGVSEYQVSRWVRNAHIVPHGGNQEKLKELGIDVYGKAKETKV